jgi:dolichol-phosphate mannosyltransferase
VKGLSIVMPAYNEQGVLAETVNALVRHLDGCDFEYEILIVNDGSADDTPAVLTALESRHSRVRHVDNPGPHGYGCAVRFGLANFSGDAVAIVMADGSDQPKDVEAYYRKIRDGYDIAFGTRFVAGTRVERYPRIKRVMNRAANAIIARLVGVAYNDFTNGFKCYRREVIASIEPLVSGQFNLTVEMSIKAVLTGARMAVIPNNWTQRESGESKFHLLRVSGLYILTIIYCLIQHRLKLAVSRPSNA